MEQSQAYNDIIIPINKLLRNEKIETSTRKSIKIDSHLYSPCFETTRKETKRLEQAKAYNEKLIPSTHLLQNETIETSIKLYYSNLHIETSKRTSIELDSSHLHSPD